MCIRDSINDVLDMSRIESGKVKIEEKAVHLPDLVHDIRSIIQPNISAKRLSLFIDTMDVVDEDIITDPLRLNQVPVSYTHLHTRLRPAPKPSFTRSILPAPMFWEV